ncbi:ATP-binding protein [Kitasatospora sp. NBC_00458]|uniref:ATP-binding protein n=1 Tax=Kitasatospora sp. NBC_00458 TaxID=2903568 RepID=UPI002E184972
MTQLVLPALALIAVAALAAAAVLARSRARALARAATAESSVARAEERARAAESRAGLGEDRAREARAEARRSAEEVRQAADRALAAEDRAHEAERAAAEATRRAVEAERATAGAERAAADAERAATAAEGTAAAAGRTAAAAGERAAEAERRTAALLAEVGHLATERVAAAALRLSHPNAPVAGPLDPAAAGPDAVRTLQAVLDATAAAVTDERERVDAAARSAMRGATSKIQTLLYQIQSLVQQLQHDNDDPRLLEVDFRNEVALRRIQTVAVLCEAWPGLARTDSPLAEVVVGALSRVPGYGRIRVANHLREGRLAVVARAAEPLAIAVAELLANATAYSHPETDVPVTVQQGGRGALVIVDDSGIGMEEDQLSRARRLLSGPPEVLLTELGNPPKTGFAVVGKLARQYGFACHIEPSPYGGMRAIVRVPAGLLTVLDEEQPLSVLTPLPLRSGAGPAPVPTVQAVPAPHTRRSEGRTAAAAPEPHAPPAIHVVPPVHLVPDDGSGLPSRRRRQPLVQRPEPAAPDEPGERSAGPSVRTPEQAAERWQALQHGTGSGRAAVALAAVTTADVRGSADARGSVGGPPSTHPDADAHPDAHPDADPAVDAGTATAPDAAAGATGATTPHHHPSPAATGPAGADRAAAPRPDADHTGAGPAGASGR